MNSERSKLSFLVILCVIGLCSNIGMSLIFTGGKEPIKDHGWPTGSVEMANLSTRVSWWAGPPFGTGSMYEFQYCCQNTNEFSQALITFAAIRAKKLELVIHNGPKDDTRRNKDASKPTDWTFTIWNPKDWDRLYNSPRSSFNSDHPNFRKPVAAPRVDVYIGGGSAIVWEQVKVPENVKVIDKRPGSVSPKFAGSGLVRGKVFDMATGKPIAGAEVVLAKLLEDHRNWKEVMHGKTNKRGICRIAKIPPGYYEVRVKAKGYASRKQGSYNNKRPEYHKFKVGLAQPSYVKGIVTDVDGNPIEGVKVSATNIIGTDGFGYPCVGDKSAITDKHGRFEIRSLPIGVMNVRCRAESLHLKNSIFEQYPIPSDEIKLVMTGTGTIWGKVVDKDGNRPAGGILLELGPEGGNKPGTWGYSGHLSPDGTFKIAGIPPGKYIISTRPNPGPADFEPNTGKITVKAGKTYELEVLHEDLRDRAINIIRKFIERRLKNE
jgi:5-hydroxyisourate hydrolase-like protein (transthyretin family)